MESRIKINVDATVFSEDRAAGIGFVARNSNGEFLWAASLPPIHTKALAVEALTLRMALILAKVLGINEVELETNA